MSVNVILFLVASLVTSQISFADGLFFDGNSNIIETISAWFRNIKEFLFGRSKPFKTPEDVEVLEMTNEEIRQMRLSHPKEFFLDLPNLRFDAEDWGFRLGNWLIIRVHESDIYSKGWINPGQDDATEDQIKISTDEELVAEIEDLETSELPEDE